MTAAVASPDRPAESPHPAKRRRVGYACDLCRTKKNRCDGERPSCGPCRERRQECNYSPQRTRIFVTQEYVDDLKHRNRVLEQQLAALQSSNAAPSPYAATPMCADADGSGGASQQQQQQQHPSPAQIRPVPPSSEKAANLEKANTPTEYYGESSTFDFLAKVGSPDKDASSHRISAGQHEANASLAASSPSVPIFEGLLVRGRTDDAFELPHRSVADKLVDAYFKHRHPLNTYLHEGTFRRRYRRLWLSEDCGGEEANAQNLAWLGLVNLVFAFGSEDAPGAGMRPVSENSRYFKRAKTLVFSGIFQPGMIELVQALLLMGQYLHCTLELNHSWTVVGLAIRTAQGLGLHLDGARFTSDVVEQEVRKRVWWGCFVLDRVLSVKVGRSPTIQDGPAIQVGFPLAVDDEFLSNAHQPPGMPSKLEYFSHIILQVRLIEKILDTLYSDSSKQRSVVADTPQLLAQSIQLDGELVAWQDALPRHLKPGTQAQEWHFERQRNILLMRFFHARLLIHRQTLLLCITRRRALDALQREIMHACVRRCVLAAHESVILMRVLHEHNLVSSFWHYSHYVFAALGVLLVYQTIVDPYTKADIGLGTSVDIEDTIRRGIENLQRVGGQMHNPLASRYVQFFQQLQSRLRTMFSSGNANPSNPPSAAAGAGATSMEQNPAAPSPALAAATTMATMGAPQAPEYHHHHHNHNHQDRPVNVDPGTGVPIQEEGFRSGFGTDDEFTLIENVLLDRTGWSGFFDEWNYV